MKRTTLCRATIALLLAPFILSGCVGMPAGVEPVEQEDLGYLKVSFFGPFYGSYIVFELDKENYQYAFVSGPDTSYVWLLAREPQVPESIRNRFVERSTELGFELSELGWLEP